MFLGACAIVIYARATGAGMGFVFGLFLGAMGDMQPLQMVNGREVPQAPLREQVYTQHIAAAHALAAAWKCGRAPVQLCFPLPPLFLASHFLGRR